MSLHDRRLAGVTAVAIVVITALALAPRSVLYPGIGVLFLVWFIALGWMLRTSEKPGGTCDCTDQDLDREARERTARRLERQVQRIHTPRLVLVEDRRDRGHVRILPPSNRDGDAA